MNNVKKLRNITLLFSLFSTIIYIILLWLGDILLNGFVAYFSLYVIFAIISFDNKYNIFKGKRYMIYDDVYEVANETWVGNSSPLWNLFDGLINPFLIILNIDIEENSRKITNAVK